MGEFILRNMVENAGMGGSFIIASAGTSREEYGNPVYPPARRELTKHGISCAGKYATQLKREDFDKYDYFLCMDESNLRRTRSLFGTDEKSYLLLSFADRKGDLSVADPWYTGDFGATYRDIVEGCEGFLRYLQEK